MAKIKIDSTGFLTSPNFILQNKRFENIAFINNIFNLTYKENLNAANEVSGTIYKEINNEKVSCWDEIINNRIIYSPELQERFIIEIPITEDTATYKQLTAKSLCECELSQINLYNVEINTETDILRDDYTEPSIFYNPDNPNASVLHRVLEKAPHYTIKYVQDSLAALTKVAEFSFNDKDIYSTLVQDIAEEYKCIFIFDSMDRSISVYDLCNTCYRCGYRGEFTDKCPECGSSDFAGQYGNDTTVYFDVENLATSISLQPNTDSLKNCFYVEGGDDIINAAIRLVNPNGSNYLYYFNEDTTNDMSYTLSHLLSDYNSEYDFYNYDCNYHLEAEAVQKFNAQVQYVWDKFTPLSVYGENISKIPSDTLTGYSETTDVMYSAINLYYILKTSMMPTIDTEGQGIQESMNSIINGYATGFVSQDTNSATFVNQIALNDYTLASQNDVERAILGTSKVFYGTAYYDLDVITSSYTQPTASTNGSWTGQFKLTSLTETDEHGNKVTLTSNSVTLEIIENSELYTQQEISRAISKSTELSKKQITSTSLSITDFTDNIVYYSLDELNNLVDIFQSCKDVLVVTDSESDMDDELLNKYITFYNDRITVINLEKVKRETQIQYVKNIYYSGDSSTDYTPSGSIYNIRKDVNDHLNFNDYIINNSDQSYLNEFYSFKREDKYSNEYYISDGLTDSEITERAAELLEEAKKELIKAGTLQYSLSTSLNNFLHMKEFKPFTDNFNVGNWVRFKVDEKIYWLRLLSYETDFSDLTKLNVEFSTVEKTYSGYSDIESVINSAVSISSSYPTVIRQIESTTSTANKINNLVSDGLNATQTKYVDSDNEDIVFDNHGILARHYDYINNRYDDNQLKILSNGLYTTSDGWNSIDAGIGRIVYRDPDTNQWVDDYGVIAKTVVGKLFIGEKLKIYGVNNSIILDDNGITLNGGSITWSSYPSLPESSITNLVNDLSTLSSSVSTAEQNAKDYADNKDSTLSTNLTTAYTNYTNTAVSILDSAVADWFGIGGNTIIGGDYIMSPYIAGGYLNIINGTGSNTKQVIIDPANLTNTGYIFAVRKGSDYTVGIDSSGNASFKGNITATSLTIAQNATVTGMKIVNATTYEYAKTTTSTRPTSGWSTTYPTSISNGDYIWTKTTISYLGGNYSDDVTYSCSYIGTNGTDGVSVTSVTIKYGLSNSTTVAPTSWSDTIPTITSLTQYVWRQTQVNFSNNLSNTTTVYDAELTAQTRPALATDITSSGVKIHPVGNNADFLQLTHDSLDIATSGLVKAHFGSTGIWIGGNSTTAASDSYYAFKVDSSGNATFSGDIKLNYISSANAYDFIIDSSGIYFDYNIGYSAYNFIVDNNGLKLGVANGGHTYGLVITNGGYITSNGSLTVNGSLNIGDGTVTYSSTDGFKLNNTVLTSPAINFYSSTLESNFGYITGNDSTYLLHINSRSLYLESTHGTLTLFPGTYVDVKEHLKISSSSTTNTANIDITNNIIVLYNNNTACSISSDSFVLYNNNTACSISSGSSGNLSFTNSSSTTVGVIGSSFSVPITADGNVSLGRSNARWSTVYATSSTISTSDRNMKKEISEINNKYEQFFMKLLPVSYLFKNGASGRTHVGFISQDVETAMVECGLTDLDFAGFCKDIKQEIYIDDNGNELTRNVTDENGNDIYIYSLRYEEFIALNTHMIQNCISKIDILENRIKNIEETIA